jgi:photosystem II stability/assembly factor-like uncharacterized protein
MGKLLIMKPGSVRHSEMEAPMQAPPSPSEAFDGPSDNAPGRRYLFVASDFGVGVFERRAAGWTQVRGGLDGKHVTSVTTRAGSVLVGTREGIFRSPDLGQSWWPSSQGLQVPYVRWLAYHPEGSGRAVAGTEPAAIFVRQSDDEPWRECGEVAKLRDSHGWSLPYSPEAGCVRGFAFHGTIGYASVEVGGLLRSDSKGESWQLIAGANDEERNATAEPDRSLNSDVHSVVVHPSSPDIVVAPTGGGLYYSGDGGYRWDHLYACYCRAVWLDPDRPAHMVLGPADGVDRRGRIEETEDGGQTWVPRMTGLVDIWPEHMVERFLQVEDALLAVLSNGELISASLDSLEWRVLIPGVQNVNAIATMWA